MTNKMELIKAAIHNSRRDGLNEPATRTVVKEQYGVAIEDLDEPTLRRMAGTCWHERHSCTTGNSPDHLTGFELKVEQRKRRERDMGLD